MTKIQVKNEDVRVALLEQAMEQNRNDHQEIKSLICELKNDFKEFKLEADKRYAPKIVATILYTVIAGVALYIVQSILRSVGLE